jgi:lambda family phage tail tape measure protein
LKNVISEDQVEIIKAQDDANVQRLAKLKDIGQQQEKLRFQLKFAKDEDKAGIEAQIGANETLRKKVEEYYKTHNDSLDYNITKLQTARKLDAARLQDMENMKKSIEDQIARQQQLGEIMRGINDKKVDLNFEKSLKGLTPLQKEIANIQESARKAALEAGRSFSAAFDSEDGLTPERSKELADGLGQIAQGYKDIAAAQIESINNINPLMDAWEEYKNKALDSSAQIKNSFENFTNGMEDALVKFVMTGKLSFKDLAQSIIADLARIAAKRAIVAIGTSLFGFANGGPVMGKTPIMVGERGPELFIPQSAGKIVPNSVLNGSAGGAGSSQGGGQTVVNYNIQAVDASSFRSLVARDPSFIYAVTEQGRRSQPTRSR